jgi:hypothetical protein
MTGCASTSYGGPDAEVTYIDINTWGYYRTIYTDPSAYKAGMGFKVLNPRLFYDSSVLMVNFNGDVFFDITMESINEKFPLLETRLNNSFKETSGKPSAVYISVHPKDPAKPRKEEHYFRLDRIEGLISLEHAQAILAQEEIAAAEKAAQDEARRLAREEANKYDPEIFLFVPDVFYPASYTKADLFEAVATSERLGTSGLTPSGIDWGPPNKSFVSDVIFVSQNGTDITFRTEDNAIRRRMKVDSRTGLTAGQRVRIYYTVYRINDWQVHAIERL